ncbi:MAG: DUF2911 domain-containing protein [Cyclobacteriaceae bacterium]
MLKKILLGLGVLVLLFVLYAVYALFIATPVSPPDTVSYSDQGIDIKVDYSRPYRKDRLLFGTEEAGALQPYGKYWRLGANQATEITLNKDILFAGKLLKAGGYRMYAVPGKEAFQIILNSELGAFFGAVEPDPELDILSIDAPVSMKSENTEQFTISFTSDATAIQMNFDWGQTSFSVPITNP